MKLWHFTAAHLLPSILREGLTRGMIPLSDDPPRLLPGFQWLTRNPAWEQACLEGTGRLPYSRTEVRLTVVVPKADHAQLLPWLSVCRQVPLHEVLNSLGDPENWMLFRGRVKPAWIRRVERRAA
jgi:hypothetical protein